jgi:hypothetical protein
MGHEEKEKPVPNLLGYILTEQTLLSIWFVEKFDNYTRKRCGGWESSGDAVQCSTVLYRAVPCCTVQCSTVLYRAVHSSTCCSSSVVFPVIKYQILMCVPLC